MVVAARSWSAPPHFMTQTKAALRRKEEKEGNKRGGNERKLKTRQQVPGWAPVNFALRNGKFLVGFLVGRDSR
jgi:hypothetical protein